MIVVRVTYLYLVQLVLIIKRGRRRGRRRRRRHRRRWRHVILRNGRRRPPRTRPRLLHGHELRLADHARVLVRLLEPLGEARRVELVVARGAFQMREFFGFGVQHPVADGAGLDAVEFQIYVFAPI